MPTISRETVLIDRRQPALRWSAVFAGAACSVGIWLVLQLLGIGAGLAAKGAADSVDTMHTAQIATTVWSLVAQVIALFFGGMVAGRLAQSYERRIAGLHGLVMWALTALVGLWATIWVITTITASAEIGGDFGVDRTNAMTAADTGKAFLVLGVSMLLSLITAVLGAVAALRKPRRPGDEYVRHVRSTDPGYPPPAEPLTTTAPYPTPMAGPATPVVPPELPRR
jgi:uncharacterized membrane protein